MSASGRFSSLFKIFFLSFALNFFWENIHSILYAAYKGAPLTEFILIRAALGDAVILTVLALPFVLSRAWRRKIWLVVPLGLIIAVAIEIFALNTGRWQYSALMPIIPVLGVGLSPTIQLALTGLISFSLVL